MNNTYNLIYNDNHWIFTFTLDNGCKVQEISKTIRGTAYIIQKLKNIKLYNFDTIPPIISESLYKKNCDIFTDNQATTIINSQL